MSPSNNAQVSLSQIIPDYWMAERSIHPLTASLSISLTCFTPAINSLRIPSSCLSNEEGSSSGSA
eukprot:1189814-Prorocentrum_minimum.AAC.2